MNMICSWNTASKIKNGNRYVVCNSGKNLYQQQQHLHHNLVSVDVCHDQQWFKLLSTTTTSKPGVLRCCLQWGSKLINNNNNNIFIKTWYLQMLSVMVTPESENSVSASAMLTGKFLRIRKVFATYSLEAEEFPDNLENVRILHKISR